MIPLCLFCIFVASLILSIPVGFMEYDYNRVNETGKVAFHFLTHHIATPYMFWVGVLVATVASLTISLYVYMFYIVRNMNTEQRRAVRTQTKLAICAFFVAMCLALISVCFCLFSFYADVIVFGNDALAFFLSCDLNTFCNVYLLLCTSKVVRGRVRMFAKRLFCCKTNEPLNSIHSVKTKTRTRVKRFNAVEPRTDAMNGSRGRRQETGV